MFQTQLKELLRQISKIQYKLQNYRQLLNQQIQFNLKDLYMTICGSITITAYHLNDFLNSFPQELNSSDSSTQQLARSNKTNRLGYLESVIKGYNYCTSMNLTFIQFSLIFISKQNHLLAKLTIQRNQLLGALPLYLKNYARKIILLQCQLHARLIQFRYQYSIQAEQWIKQHTILNQQTNQQELDVEIIQKYSNELQIDNQLIVQNFRLTAKENIQYQRMLALLTLKNSANIGKFIQKNSKNIINNKKQIQILNKKFNKNQCNPYIRPQFNDCLQRPIPCQQISNFSHRQIKSIQKHLHRLNSPNKIQINQKIKKYTKKIQLQVHYFCYSLRQIIKLQKQLQYQKIQLALCTSFYPVLFFDSFHKDSKLSSTFTSSILHSQLLLPSLMKQYLQKFGINIPIKQIYLLFRRYSSRNDGKLNFNQFCMMFDLSAKNQKYYGNIQKNRQVRSLQDVDYNTKKLFLRVIKCIIRNQVKVDSIKRKLCYGGSINKQEQQQLQCKGQMERKQSQKQISIKTAINLREIFSYFDNDEDGYISQTDFRVIYKRIFNLNLSQQEIGYWWHRIIKKNSNSNSVNIGDNNNNEIANQMISYQQFINQMVPKSKEIKVKNNNSNNNKMEISQKMLKMTVNNMKKNKYNKLNNNKKQLSQKNILKSTKNIRNK